MKAERVLWALHPYELETRPDVAALRQLGEWVLANGFELVPAHVLYVPGGSVPAAEQEAWIGQYLPAVQNKIASYLSGSELPRLAPARVLPLRGGGRDDAIRLLLDEAEQLGASWIVASSHGRSGLSRMTLGSFAERLLLLSPVPVWMFGRGGPAELSQILFATDFSEPSHRAFQGVLEQAALLRANLCLFHSLALPRGTFAETGVMGTAPYISADAYLESESAWVRSEAAQWIGEAQERGVQVEFVLKTLEPNISNAILAEASRRRCGVIALASQSGPVAAALLGSHARRVIRHARCAVWVFGSKACARAALDRSRAA